MGQMISLGVVREYHPEEGWGVIDGPDVPGGCWVHFSAIVMDGYRELTAGEKVSFRWETTQNQDGYTRRAVEVWPGAHKEPAEPVEPAGTARTSPPGRYHSRRNISFDSPGMSTRRRRRPG